MYPEIYIENDRYAFHVLAITTILQRDFDTIDDRIMSAMISVGRLVDKGALFIVDGYVDKRRVTCTHYADLAEALARIEPSAFSGEIDENDVKLVLGEVGNIWPESVQADALAQRAIEGSLRPDHMLALLD